MQRGGRLLLPLLIGLLSAAVALLARPASASPGWEIILDRPTPDFGSIDFVSDSEGWMTAGGGLLHTTDGGATWTEAARISVASIDFFDREHGWAVGASGAIWATADGGVTWNAQASGTQIHLGTVHAVSPTEAWVLGRGEGYSDVITFPKPTALLHTTDGGQTWISVPLPPNSEFSEMVFAGDSGWLLGQGCTPPPEYQYCSPNSVDLLRTTDGGTTWTLQPTDLPGIVHSLAFADETRGWLSASACVAPDNCIIGVYRTSDGGATWTLGDLGAQGLVWGLAFSDATTGWVVEQDCPAPSRCTVGTPVARILRTDDGAVTWSQAGTLHLPSDLQTASRLTLRGSALYLTGSGVGYRSLDGGATWQVMQHPAITFDSNIELVDTQIGYVISRGDLLRSNDAGRNWQRVGPVPDGARFQLRFSDANGGFTTGHETCAGGSCTSVLWRTRDGGDTWEQAFTITGESQYFGDLRFLGQRGWLVLEGAIAVTSDGGTTWTQHALPGGWRMQGLAVADATNLWAILGTIEYPNTYELRHSIDDGQTWQTVLQLPDFAGPVLFVDRDHGWYQDYTCGDGCVAKLHATTDGGRTWREQDPGAGYLNSIAFVDRLNGWANGTGCPAFSCGEALLHTADGGDTWTTQLSGRSIVGQLDFVDVEHGWLALSPYRGQGIGGGPAQRTVLYRTTDAGGGSIGKEPELPKLGSGNVDDSWAASALLLALLGCALVAAGAAILRRRD